MFVVFWLWRIGVVWCRSLLFVVVRCLFLLCFFCGLLVVPCLLPVLVLLAIVRYCLMRVVGGARVCVLFALGCYCDLTMYCLLMCVVLVVWLLCVVRCLC